MRSNSIHLILATDCINQPLTGIGRYAFELSKGLSHFSEIESIRYFSHGYWANQPEIDSDYSTTHQKNNQKSWRAHFAGNAIAARLYASLIPSLSKWQLKNEKHAIFHSPSYFLPPFSGQSVTTIHDLSHVIYPEFHPSVRVDYINRELPKTLARADHLITVSESVRQEIIKHFQWNPEKITAIALGVDSVFKPRNQNETQTVLNRYGLKHGNYILNVGTIEPRKNIERLLSAYEELPESIKKHYPLVIIGEHGWNSQHIHDKMQNAAAKGWLHYLRYIPQNDLPYLYSGARLFVYPSLYEGFGLPIVEALASGVSVITSNVSAMVEVGKNATLINPLDLIELKDNLLKLLSDDSSHQNNLRNSNDISNRIKNHYQWNRCCAETIRVYQKLLKNY